MYLYISLLVAFPALTLAASLPSTLDITETPRLANLTSYASLQAQGNDSKVNGDIWSWYCTKDMNWSLPKVHPDDCLGVLDYFYIETMHDGGFKIKEFLSPDADKPADLEPQWTPRKYTFGKAYFAQLSLFSLSHSSRFEMMLNPAFRVSML